MAGAVKVKSPSQRAREEARQQRESAQKRRRTLMFVAGGAAVIAVVTLIVLGAVGRGGDNGGGIALEGLTTEGKTLGSATAPVTITAWEDFQCPFCKQANDGALAQVVTDYVNTGKVKIIYQQFPFLGNGGSKDESIMAAQASECAAEQQQFWPYHDKLFAAQPSGGENRGVYSATNLKKWAGELGLDQAAFNSCLDSGKYKAAVQAEKKEGDSLGISSTPTFFINGQQVSGAQPYAVFKDAIDKALKAAGQ